MNAATPDTPISLLERLRLRPDTGAWERLVELYEPLIYNWIRRFFVPLADAEDVAQEVLGVMVRDD